MKKRLIILMAVIMVFAFVPIANTNYAEDISDVTISLNMAEDEFGQVEMWEASLYEGAVAGEETAGRFTEWKPIDNEYIQFELPGEVREGDEVPWNVEMDTYVRLRSMDDQYPEFDFVSAPFTLGEDESIDVALNLNTEVNVVDDQDEGEALVSLILFTGTNEFGHTEDWEASLYAGAEAGEETAGRFTEWKPADEGGHLAFEIPEEVRDGDEAPWDAEYDTYLRIRSTDDDAYPQFDIVTEPFTLEETHNYSISVTLESMIE
ncbi:hypothetical protein I0Q91_04035 [Halanaerobiaceae bacterium Z-7014]|uniref:Uncharacterized protein n=1 Tax=Halonatronomonas betaini TaxID=2778430 RepID=A0A931ATB6_9FIRM|nr:hypothetical protein [Halonatronomonas betaini]MBF8436239.1 hypothetical protein [Halonatronomonas betaini]